MRFLVVHGPSLDALGTREPEIYGHQTLVELNDMVSKAAVALGATLDIHQSAREGEIIELLLGAVGTVDGAILNPAAYAHTSRAIADAIRSVPYPVIEVHLSNIHARESWRSVSVTAEAAAGVITGLGPLSYIAALEFLTRIKEG